MSRTNQIDIYGTLNNFFILSYQWTSSLRGALVAYMWNSGYHRDVNNFRASLCW